MILHKDLHMRASSLYSKTIEHSFTLKRTAYHHIAISGVKGRVVSVWTDR
jgi:hypothetical protein